MTSDEFFAKFDPRDALGSKIDLAFLDGQHLFEYVLRDFMNTEAVCEENSFILLHDCSPSTRGWRNASSSQVSIRRLRRPGTGGPVTHGRCCLH